MPTWREHAESINNGHGSTEARTLMITREIAFVQGCGLAVNKLSHGAYMKRVHILLLFILQIQMTLKCSV